MSTDERSFTTEHLLTILSHSPNATAVYSGFNIIIELANDQMLNYWGKDHRIIGRPLGEALPELEGQPFLDILKIVVETGKNHTAKDAISHLVVDGRLQTFYFDYTFQAVCNPIDGEFCVLHTATDVTDRHRSMETVDVLNEDLASLNAELVRANEQLNVINEQLIISQHESELQRQRLHDFFMQAPAGICVLGGPELVFELINSGYQQLLPKRELMGRAIFEALPELMGQPIEQILHTVYRSGESRQIRELLVPLAEKEGETEKERYFTFNYLPRKEADGTVSGILAFVYEVTDQVAARQKVEESEFHFRHLADLVPAKISNALPSGEVTFFNKQWLDYSGLGFEDLRDFGYHKMMHPDEIADFQAGLAEAASTGKPYEREMRFMNTEGQYRWHLNIASPIRDENGMVKMWVGSTTDIQKIKEEEQRKLDFISMLSHELKTPITAVKGYVQLMLRAVVQDTKTQYPPLLQPSLTRVDQLLVQLTKLVTEMLGLAGIESQQVDIRPAARFLNEIVREIVKDFRFTHPAHTVHLREDFHCYVNVDQDKFGQVLINLLSNAVKYAPNSRSIDVRIFQTANADAGVSVRDYGIGIDKKEHTNIFNRFYRVEGKEGPPISGFGIGLYIAHSIMTRHKGSITLKSEKGKGSTFIISFPVIPGS